MFHCEGTPSTISQNASQPQAEVSIIPLALASAAQNQQQSCKRDFAQSRKVHRGLCWAGFAQPLGAELCQADPAIHADLDTLAMTESCRLTAFPWGNLLRAQSKQQFGLPPDKLLFRFITKEWFPLGKEQDKGKRAQTSAFQAQ